MFPPWKATTRRLQDYMVAKPRGYQFAVRQNLSSGAADARRGLLRKFDCAVTNHFIPELIAMRTYYFA
jgi:hypothetical protein